MSDQRLSPHSLERFDRALDLSLRGQTAQARALAAALVREDPDNVAAWALLAHLCYPADPERAAEALRQVLRLRPTDSGARERLALVEAELSRPMRHRKPLPAPDTWVIREDGAPVPADPAALPAPRLHMTLPVVLFITLGLLAGGWGFAALLLPGISQAAPEPDLAPTLTPSLNPPPLFAAGTLDFSGLADPTRTPPPVPVSLPTPTLVPVPIDYRPLTGAIERFLQAEMWQYDYDIGVGFVDIRTGQVLSFRGDGRYHAMSSFKGPLAVQYFQLLERGEIEPGPRDARNLELMLGISSNSDTTCIFDAVGGVPAFNDWMASQGFSRTNNFVLSWQDISCALGEGRYASARQPDFDWRYSRGDLALGLPGGSELLQCPIPQVPCDKAFAPIELAQFYARLYRGGLISDEHRAQLLGYMAREYPDSVFMVDLPPDAPIHVYTKGGTYQATDEYRVNFFNEAGIIETPNGAFALAIFMQRNPDWPGTGPIETVTRMIYEFYVQTHAPLQ